MQKKVKSHRKLKIATLVSCIIVVALLVAFFIYTSVYYHAGQAAQQVFTTEGIVATREDGYTLVVPAGEPPKTGLVLYPGAKVEPDAYLPLLALVAQEGYLCAVVEVPFHFAILGSNAADKVINSHTEIETWAVGGHSLGGVVAAGYAGKSLDVSALVLLASYPNENLSDSGLAVLSAAGSEDGVLSWEKYDSTKTSLPADTHFLLVEGGNHAGFGDYGAQKGDGAASIQPQQQWAETAEAITALLNKTA